MSKIHCVCGLALGVLVAGTPKEGSCMAAEASLIGRSAPDFVLKGMDGRNQRLSEYRGQVVLVNFWARWAGDSREELPVLDRINSTYSRAGLVVLGVSLGDDPRRARDFAQGMKLKFPVLFDTTSTTGRDYSVQKMPMTILIDRSGVVRFVDAGFKPGDDQTYLDQVRELLSE